MANTWSKDKILTTYLNIVPYGAITYGCEAAALRFYSTHCRFLTIDQAATLAGLPQNPIVYNPIAYPKAALEQRRNEVLQAMLDAGYITQSQYNVNVRRPLGIHPGNYLDDTHEGYFVSWVRQQLEQNYGTAEVERGGLKVYTSPRPEAPAGRRTTALTNTMNWADAPTAAMVAIDPRTGQVLAMDASIALQPQEPVQPAGQRRPHRGLDLQGVHAERGDRRRDRSQHLPGAVRALELHVPEPADRPQQPVERRHRRDRDLRLSDDDHAGHDRVGQHRVRPAGDRHRRRTGS